MKFLLPVALLASAAAAAECGAEDIVQTCLKSETAKFEACKEADYDCKCAAQESIATCYNNCPDDSRSFDAQGQVKIHCGNAELYGDKSKSKSAEPTKTDSKSEPTDDSDSDSDSDSKSGSKKDSDSESESDSSEALGDDGSQGGAADTVLDMGRLLIGVAGVMAAMV